MSYFPNISRLLLAFAVSSAMLPGMFCAVAKAGCGDYLHTKMGPPVSARLAEQLAARLSRDGHTVAVHHQPNSQPATATLSPPAAPARPCTGWQCRQQKTPWLPAPRPVPVTSFSADAVLAGLLSAPATNPVASPLCTPEPLPARSAPAAGIDYPPECCRTAG